MTRQPSCPTACRRPRRPRRAGGASDRLAVPVPLAAALAVLWLCAGAAPARAQLPTAPNVVAGSASVVTAGPRMTVTNSPGAIIEWRSFSIGSADGVHFQQQGAASQVLNRVTGTDASQILGSLSSNGRVWLVNPYGVLFGREARIDVAGLVASTLAVSNADFLAGRFAFGTDGGGAADRAEVVNRGDIRTAFGGHVWLVGGQARNEGLVEAPGGRIVLAAGRSVELVDSGLPHVVVRVTAPDDRAVNLGTLAAAGGSIDLHGGIVNQDGIVRADRLGTDAAGRIVLRAGTDATLGEAGRTSAAGGTVALEAGGMLDQRGEVAGDAVALAAGQVLLQGRVAAPGGSVTIDAAATAYLDGAVDVSAPGGAGGGIRIATGRFEGMAGGSLRADGRQGGRIDVRGRDTVAFSSTLTATGSEAGGTIEASGERVFLLAARVDASGGERGGTVHLGGGWQGGGTLPHAREIVVGRGSDVGADGTAGGGEIVVRSTQSSEQHGTLHARDGGRIELSSPGRIRLTGALQPGAGGSVLLDPKNLVVTDSPPDSVTLARKVVSGSVAPDLADNDQFGFSLALDGDRLVVGTPFDGTGGTGRGAVHLFSGVGGDFAGLVWRKKLVSGAGAAGMPVLADKDEFGSAVALDGDRLVVGAWRDGTGGTERGALHLFNGVGSDFSGLAWRGRLASGSGARDMPALAVGAAYDDGVSGTNRGAVHLFNGVGSDSPASPGAGASARAANCPACARCSTARRSARPSLSTATGWRWAPTSTTRRPRTAAARCSSSPASAATSPAWPGRRNSARSAARPACRRSVRSTASGSPSRSGATAWRSARRSPARAARCTSSPASAAIFPPSPGAASSRRPAERRRRPPSASATASARRSASTATASPSVPGTTTAAAPTVARSTCTGAWRRSTAAPRAAPSSPPTRRGRATSPRRASRRCSTPARR